MSTRSSGPRTGGLATVLGDATDRRFLGQAGSDQVGQVVVAVAPDETALLITMLARELCPSAVIVTAVRQHAHLSMVRDHGADQVFTTAQKAGEELGHAATGLVTSRVDRPFDWVIDDRPVRPSEIGHPPHACVRTAIGVLRGPDRRWVPDARAQQLAAGDRVVFLTTQSTPDHDQD